MLATILSTVDGEVLANVLSTVRVLHYDEHSIGIMSIQGDGEAKFGGEILLDVDPIVSRVETLVDATMVLLI